MSFDKNWEVSVYKKKLQNNKYPFDSIVSSTFQFMGKNLKNKNILELGCGTGNNLIFFQNLKCKNIEGVDGSKTAISIAKKNLSSKNTKLVIADFTKVKLKQNYFDLVIDRGSITHNSKKNIIIILNKVQKSLRKNSFFFSSVFSSHHYGNKKKKKSFHQEINSKQGLISSFFTKKEIMQYYKKFEIVSLQLEEKIDFMKKKKKISWWNLILKKND